MKIKLMVFAMAVLGVTIYACKKESTSGGTTPVRVRMTDAPGNYDAVYINIASIEIKKDGEDFILPVSGRYNLLDFSNGIDTLIASGDIPSGKISQIRLILKEDSNDVVIDGISYPLTTPSAQTSGLKLSVHATLEPGILYTLLLDFDASRSIVSTGSGKYNLKPVIRVIDKAISGAIAGTVNPAMANPMIVAISGTDTFGASPDSLGKFLIQGVAAGTYSVSFDAVSGFNDTTINGVAVTVGAKTEMGTIQLQ